MSDIKHTLKAIMVIVAVIAAAIIMMYAISLFGCAMIDYADTCEIPL